MTHATALRLAALLLATPLVAQSTWVVDAANGPGTHFTDLPPAVLAAAHGDTLLVRPGTYNGCTIDKGLRVLGGPGVAVHRVTLGGVILELTGIPAGRELVLEGLLLQSTTSVGIAGLIRVVNCAGPVVLEEVVAEFPLQTPYPIQPTPPAVQVSGCAAVSLNRCRLRGSPGLQVSDSTVAAGSCTVAGIQGGKFPFSGLPIASSPAFDLLNATVLLTQPDGQGGGGFGLTILPVPPSPAVRMSGGRLVVAGDNSARLASGSVGSSFTGSAVVASGDLLIDPDVQLLAAGAAPPITGGAAVVLVRLPALTAAGAAPGGSLTADLHSEPGHLELLLASTAVVPLASPLGQLWVAPTSFLVLDVGVQGASGHRATTVPIPPDPALRGLPIVLQALSGPVPALGLSTPASVVLH